MPIEFPEPGTELYRIEQELLDARIIERKNRFLVSVECLGNVMDVHLHDPGRIRELIFPGNFVKIRKTHGVKTSYSITSARRGKEDVLMDTRFHSAIAENFLKGEIRREVQIGDSRFDFTCDESVVEVKGCTLLKGDTIYFPDAPTQRGTKHLNGLSRLSSRRTCAVIFLMISREARYFLPNRETDFSFSSAFLEAIKSGVNMYFPKIELWKNSIIFRGNANLGQL